MKRTVICNIPMKRDIANSVYTSEDSTLPVCEVSVKYPVNAVLGKILSEGDQVKVLLLVKKDHNDYYVANTQAFIDELNQINNDINTNLEYVTIETDFDEDKIVHDKLMGSLVDAIDTESHLIVDITFGPKDLPLVVFSALQFAEKFLDCQIDNIIYGQGFFNEKNEVIKTKLCDMSPLYYLNSVTNMITCREPDKARKMLKNLLSF
ncbi:TM1812 family CRISPR-associated protein [Hornefia butyriciproducens]|uniref:TM1812 family CRISPR-associated protein n=1 Tax=Hornefia butyriciproducens TaxID=2652293 RepID=UPI003F8C17CB